MNSRKRIQARVMNRRVRRKISNKILQMLRVTLYVKGRGGM